MGGGGSDFFLGWSFPKAMFECHVCNNFSKRIESLWWGGGVYTQRTRRTPLIRLQHNVKTKNSKDNESINIVKKHQAIPKEFVVGLETSAWRKQNLSVFCGWSY